MDSEQEGKTNTHSLSSSIDPTIEGLISITSASSFSSSSSSSSDGSFDTLLELNNTKSDNNKGTTPKIEQESPNSPKPVSEDSIQWAVKQSPPVQTMGRPNNVPGYDPNRIPSNIFSSKPNSALDWSVASNESLFSIHMGNNSFSGDHAILLGGKSGEFCNFDDLISNAPSQQPKPNEVNNSPYNLSTVIEASSDIENSRQSLSTEEKLNTEKRGELTSKTDMKVIVEDNHKETTLSKNSSNNSDGRETLTRESTRKSASIQRLSDVSGTNSSSSFAFPVLVGEAGNYPPVKTIPEIILPIPIEKPKRETQTVPQKPTVIQKAFGTRLVSWFRKKLGFVLRIMDKGSVLKGDSEDDSN